MLFWFSKRRERKRGVEFVRFSCHDFSQTDSPPLSSQHPAAVLIMMMMTEHFADNRDFDELLHVCSTAPPVIDSFGIAVFEILSALPRVIKTVTSNGQLLGSFEARAK